LFAPLCTDILQGFHSEVESSGLIIYSGDFCVSGIFRIACEKLSGIFCFAKHHLELVCPIARCFALAAQDVEQDGISQIWVFDLLCNLDGFLTLPIDEKHFDLFFEFRVVRRRDNAEEHYSAGDQDDDDVTHGSLPVGLRTTVRYHFCGGFQADTFL